MPALKIVQGVNVGVCFDLGDRECLIGREHTCHVRLPGRTVSRQHARILSENDGCYVEDMRSVNGTGLNGLPIEGRTRLQDGDHLQIYDTVFKFYAEEPSGDVSPSPEPVETLIHKKDPDTSR